MLEPPAVGECYQLARSRHLVLVPYFISDGLHVSEDLPVLLGEPKPLMQERLGRGLSPWHNPTERNGKLVWFTPSVGTEPVLVEVILARVREAAGASVRA
jgi:sirohydrochlorin ferrochelatase